MFNEICIYKAKLTRLDEIEELMREVAEFYLKQDLYPHPRLILSQLRNRKTPGSRINTMFLHAPGVFLLCNSL